jgi:hypothetical protein
VARIRTVKPDYWTDERVGECSVSARLLFIACWNFADDHGGLDRSAKQLKAQAFPYDAIDCEPLVQELLNAGLLVEYAVDGKKYLHIKGFRKHQKVEKPAKPRIPLYDDSANTHRVLTEPSPASSGSSLGMEGNGREVEEDTHSAGAREMPTATRLADQAEARVMFQRVQKAYPPFAGRQDWVMAEHYCRVRIDEGSSWNELVDAVKRYAAYVKAGGVSNTSFVLSPVKFFSAPDKPWTQQFPLPEKIAKPAVVGWRPDPKDDPPLEAAHA